MKSIIPLSLGTALYGSGIPQDQAFSYLDQFIEGGGDLLDTAHVYASWLPDGTGASERCLGNWMKKHNNRSEIRIMTKGAHPDLKLKLPRLTEADLQQDISESLERLQTNYIDIYWLHRDDKNIPINEVAQWMHQFQAQGFYTQYGVSNWDSERIQALIEYAAQYNLHGPIGNQFGYSLARVKAGTGAHADTRYMQPDSFTWHQEHQFPVYAFSSQASGLFAKCHSFAALMGHARLNDYKDPSNSNLLEMIQQISAKYNISPNQLALAALLHSPFPCIPIIGPSNSQQMEDSLQAAKVKLEAADVSALFSHWHSS